MFNNIPVRTMYLFVQKTTGVKQERDKVVLIKEDYVAAKMNHFQNIV